MAADDLLVTMRFVFPRNQALEQRAQLLWCDDSGARREQFYADIAQGGELEQLSHQGHRWVLREAASRELLLSVTARLPAGGGGSVQYIVIAADGGAVTDPLRAALWRMGTSPREHLTVVCPTLLKLVNNILSKPQEPKYRSIRMANPSIGPLFRVDGCAELLRLAGFKECTDSEGEKRLVCEEGTCLSSMEDAAVQLKRLHALIIGLPPPPETLRSMQQSATAAASSVAAASADATAQPSHRCHKCKAGIDNDLRRQMAGSGEVGGWRSHGYIGPGEYRFHCDECNVDLCSKCYDKWKNGDRGDLTKIFLATYRDSCTLCVISAPLVPFVIKVFAYTWL
uniref:PUB domain-containing protein n=1 Tax=Chrysotila carterae TaxID=13221 RepID=A0A7S4B2L3_CHRCT